MKKIILATLLVAVSGCGNEENIQNACAEISSTTQGFSGPSKRMEILKSYGFTPAEGQEIESYLQDKFKLANLEYKTSCARQMLEAMSCKNIVSSVVSDDGNFMEQIILIDENC